VPPLEEHRAQEWSVVEQTLVFRRSKQLYLKF